MAHSRDHVRLVSPSEITARYLSRRTSDDDAARESRENTIVAASRTVDLTVRGPPPPRHSRSWSRGESRRPICFVTANARLLLLLLLLLLLVILRICPSRRLLRGLRRP